MPEMAEAGSAFAEPAAADEESEGFSGDDYWPEEMEPQDFYQPVERGFERKVRERLDYWAKLRGERGG